MIFVDAGTVHAIWPGSILLETQQNCDLTYRMYDYGRGRELHIEKSLEATKLATRAGKVAPRRARRPHGADRCGVLSRGADSCERQPDQRKPARRGRGSAGSRICLRPPERAGLRARDSSRSICPRAALWPFRRLRPSLSLEDLGGLDLIRITPNWP